MSTVCPNCSSSSEGWRICPKCGCELPYTEMVPPIPPARDIAADPAMRWVLPVGTSPWAIVAGYLGLLFVVPLFGPLALIFAFLALQDIRRNPSLSGTGRAVVGIVGGLVGTAFTIFLFGGLLFG